MGLYFFSIFSDFHFFLCSLLGAIEDSCEEDINGNKNISCDFVSKWRLSDSTISSISDIPLGNNIGILNLNPK